MQAGPKIFETKPVSTKIQKMRCSNNSKKRLKNFVVNLKKVCQQLVYNFINLRRGWLYVCIVGSASSDESGEESYELRKDRKRKPRTESERAAIKVNKFCFQIELLGYL